MDDFRDDLHIEDFDENGDPIIAKKKAVLGDDDFIADDDLPEDALDEENLDVLGLSDEDFG
ncbi:MAG: hypothetical protein JWM20_683 [Patescibacteria group bacterium]|nr:hypothetical protein [Patescibacteria group bacterium]